MVIQLKKIFYLLILIIGLFLINEISLKDKTVMVMNDFDNIDQYKNYLIELDNINTNNFNDFFTDLNILAIYPKINPIYKDRLPKAYVYKDIDTFKENYLDELKASGCYVDVMNYITRPIDIEKILVYTSKNEIMFHYKNSSINKCIDENFDCIKLIFNKKRLKFR